MKISEPNFKYIAEGDTITPHSTLHTSRSSLHTIKKPAPGIPRTVLLEPYSFHQKFPGVIAEGFQLLLRALDNHPQGLVEIQAEHFHEAAAPDFMLAVPDADGEGTGGGDGNKFFHILHAA